MEIFVKSRAALSFLFYLPPPPAVLLLLEGGESSYFAMYERVIDFTFFIRGETLLLRKSPLLQMSATGVIYILEVS